MLTSTRHRAVALGLVRVGLGAALLARPEPLVRLAGVDRGTARRSGWLARMVGVREVAVGGGLALAGVRGADVRPWLLVAAACDGGDAAVGALALRSGTLGALAGAALVLAGGGGAAAHAALAAAA